MKNTVDEQIKVDGVERTFYAKEFKGNFTIDDVVRDINEWADLDIAEAYGSIEKAINDGWVKICSNGFTIFMMQ